MKRIDEKTILWVLLVILTFVQLLFLWKNEVVYEGADNITHFHMARYAFKYPHLFLDLWGKPVFTTLLAPFTFLGFKGAQILNLLIAVLTLIFTFNISKSIFPKGALVIVVLTAFAPVYFLLMLSTLTEILFSFVLVVSVYLFIKNKFIFSALVLSFIPFVRSEGIILLPVFAVAFSLKRNWPAIPVLAFGTLFYSIVGYFAFGDILWLIHRFPYPTGSSVYGSGELLHFVKMRNQIFGLPLVVFSLAGLICWMIEIFRKFSLKSNNLILFIIIAGSWIGYFAAHSFVWWQGMGGSLGLIRVMGGIIPLAAITGIKGIQFFYQKVKFPKMVSLVLVLAATQPYLFFKQQSIPIKANPVDKLIAQSAEFLKNENTEGRIFYFNPVFAFQLGLNPYDSATNGWFFGDKIQPSNSMEFGDILIWDAHFGPNEGGTSYETMERDPWLQKIKTILPEEKITVLGGYEYAIHIYRKVKQPAQQPLSEEFFRKLEFGKPDSEKEAGSEEEFLKVLTNQAYSPTILVYMHELKQKDLFDFELNIQYKGGQIFESSDVLLVLSVENGKESLDYTTFPLLWEQNENEWKNYTFSKRIAANLPESAVIKIYVWNRGKKMIYLKELSTRITSY
jgi:hypothetical protein